MLVEVHSRLQIVLPTCVIYDDHQRENYPIIALLEAVLQAEYPTHCESLHTSKYRTQNMAGFVKLTMSYPPQTSSELSK